MIMMIMMVIMMMMIVLMITMIMMMMIMMMTVMMMMMIMMMMMGIAHANAQAPSTQRSLGRTPSAHGDGETTRPLRAHGMCRNTLCPSVYGSLTEAMRPRSLQNNLA